METYDLVGKVDVFYLTLAFHLHNWMMSVVSAL